MILPGNALGERREDMKIVKFEVWHGGELHNTYQSEEKAKEIAKMLDEQPGSVWINKITVERIKFK